MELESKELLLKDLGARLSYRVMLNIKGQDGSKPFNFDEILYDIFLDGNYLSINNRGSGDNPGICEIKPYLRPMSNMTEEEKHEMKQLFHDNTNLVFKDPHEVRPYRFYDTSVVDWLLAHHFDFRGLIPLGLALEATKGMYGI